MKLAVQLAHNGSPKTLVCEALGVPKATFYRNITPKFYGPPKPRKRPVNRIPDAMRTRILEVLHEVQYVDLTPWEVVPRLLDQGEYLGSIRTFYRVLSENGEVKERRLQAKRGKHAAPVLEATAPCQVWTWDITRLKGPYQGKWYFLYLMLDLYSRYVVGWMIAEHESARKAQHFIRETVRNHLKGGAEVTIHSDRGAPMTANTTRELLSLLGISQSLSRPRTSDDNPFSESQFKTIKYHGSFPSYFEGPEHAISHLDQFLTWYNNEHMHGGLNLHTPVSVHFGRVDGIVMRRQAVLDAAYAENPNRFPNGKPIVKANPPVVGINLNLKAAQVATVESESSTG
ncbi:MAG TPA: IS3 family transposase, partial [Pirellulaceae bacterium]